MKPRTSCPDLGSSRRDGRGFALRSSSFASCKVVRSRTCMLTLQHHITRVTRAMQGAREEHTRARTMALRSASMPTATSASSRSHTSAWRAAAFGSAAGTRDASTIPLESVARAESHHSSRRITSGCVKRHGRQAARRGRRRPAARVDMRRQSRGCACAAAAGPTSARSRSSGSSRINRSRSSGSTHSHQRRRRRAPSRSSR